MQGVTVTKMPVDKALEAYRHYKKLLTHRKDATVEDHCIMMGYKAMSKGLGIINLVTALRDAGLNDQRLPRLAIARADWKNITFFTNRHYYKTPWGGGQFWDLRNYGDCRAERIEIPSNTWNFRTGEEIEGRAMVPVIPLELRPPAVSLNKFYILWEAEWTLTSPRDPFLLKHLGGPMYAVLAMWNLTKLERAVIGGGRHLQDPSKTSRRSNRTP